MKFVQFAYKNRPDCIRLGYMDGCCVVDVNAREQAIPNTMLEFLQNDVNFKLLQDLKTKHPCCTSDVNNVIIKAPICGMDKIICMGLNYKDYCEQHNVTPPPVPMLFSKFASTVIGPNASIAIRTDVTQKVDWEVQLGVVIGKVASFVEAKNAFKYVFGCTIAQDITARDWQKEKNAGQFLLGKCMDTFCPLGPYIVSLDEIGDPENLAITCMMNGVYKQKSNTQNMIYKIPEVIERITSVMTLLPGDIIMTGTPGGVGMYANPPEFLKPGDILRSEIEKIGILETTVEKYVKPLEY